MIYFTWFTDYGSTRKLLKHLCIYIYSASTKARQEAANLIGSQQISSCKITNFSCEVPTWKYITVPFFKCMIFWGRTTSHWRLTPWHLLNVFRFFLQKQWQVFCFCWMSKWVGPWKLGNFWVPNAKGLCSLKNSLSTQRGSVKKQLQLKVNVQTSSYRAIGDHEKYMRTNCIVPPMKVHKKDPWDDCNYVYLPTMNGWYFHVMRSVLKCIIYLHVYDVYGWSPINLQKFEG